MAKKREPPEIPPELVAAYGFVRDVRDGRIKAESEPDCSAGAHLRAVADMLEKILRGEDPKAVLGVPDKRALRSKYHRDVKLARAVLVASERLPNVDEAISEIASGAGLEHETVRKAYYKHQRSARAWRRLCELLEGGN